MELFLFHQQLPPFAGGLGTFQIEKSCLPYAPGFPLGLLPNKNGLGASGLRRFDMAKLMHALQAGLKAGIEPWADGTRIAWYPPEQQMVLPR